MIVYRMWSCPYCNLYHQITVFNHFFVTCTRKKLSTVHFNKLVTTNWLFRALVQKCMSEVCWSGRVIANYCLHGKWWKLVVVWTSSVKGRERERRHNYWRDQKVCLNMVEKDYCVQLHSWRENNLLNSEWLLWQPVSPFWGIDWHWQFQLFYKTRFYFQTSASCKFLFVLCSERKFWQLTLVFSASYRLYLEIP